MIIVLDTNVLIGSMGKTSPYRIIFDSFLNAHFTLALSNELLMEDLEVLQIKTSDEVAENIVMTLMTSKNMKLHNVYFRWKLITGDADDDKFYDLAVAPNAITL